MTDTTQQRINMVDSQVRPSDVTDRRIIKAMLEVPREAFAPGPQHALAYMDEPLPVTMPGAGGPVRTLLAPRTLAKMLQLAEVEPECAVLDVGCATGYSTVLLSKLAGKVVALEVDAGLAERARGILRDLGIQGATVTQGPLETGVAAEAPFDAILLNGAVPEVPQVLLDQLKDGGRLVAIVAREGCGRVQVWRRTGRAFASRAVFDAAGDALPGFARAVGFVF
jgi:protein-L-isoaspartate(D-aspartate) O-methyltransferase